MLGQNVAEKLEDAEAGEASGVSRSVCVGGGGSPLPLCAAWLGDAETNAANSLSRTLMGPPLFVTIECLYRY